MFLCVVTNRSVRTQCTYKLTIREHNTTDRSAENCLFRTSARPIEMFELERRSDKGLYEPLINTDHREKFISAFIDPLGFISS